MKRGEWHQCGDKSQRIVQEQLEHGNGVGVVVSPRDLALRNAIDYATEYRNLGAEVLIDHQFYVPEFANSNLVSYPASQHRASISQLNQISDTALTALARDLERTSRDLGTSALVAPAVIYEAGRQDIVQLNARLFGAAKAAGDNLGVPTIATVVLGKSVAMSMQTLSPVLSQVTGLNANGWYFGFEFGAPRIPAMQEDIERVGKAILTLACSGQPLLHAYAGPMALLSHGFGATGAAIGHAQNTWQFTPERWQQTAGQGGGGDAPPRFFSSGLWGTIIYPDETERIPSSVLADVMTHSPFSAQIARRPPQSWSRWDANKHLVYEIGKSVRAIAQATQARKCADASEAILNKAIQLHGTIASSGLTLADGTSSYQHNWSMAVRAILRDQSTDYDFLEMIP